MKRSITLLISNIFATIWTLILLYSVFSFFAKGGGENFVWAHRMNYFLSDLLETMEDIQIFATFVNVFYILVSLYTAFYTLATILGWVGYIAKSRGSALAAAMLFLVGTLFCMFFVLFSLHIIILSFIAQGCQGKVNLSCERQMNSGLSEQT